VFFLFFDSFGAETAKKEVRPPIRRMGEAGEPVLSENQEGEQNGF
jgi:hypothetical protein